jgi:hypothetical protein
LILRLSRELGFEILAVGAFDKNPTTPRDFSSFGLCPFADKAKLSGFFSALIPNALALVRGPASRTF